MSDLGRDVMMLHSLVDEIAQEVDTIAYGFLTDETREQYLICHKTLEDIYKTLNGAKTDLGERLAESMPEKMMETPVGAVEAKRGTTRTAWDKEDLLRAVLDTKLVDLETGEVTDETPLDKVLTVFNLPAPRTTALRQRGLDPDEFCHTEPGRLSLRWL